MGSSHWELCSYQLITNAFFPNSGQVKMTPNKNKLIIPTNFSHISSMPNMQQKRKKRKRLFYLVRISFYDMYFYFGCLCLQIVQKSN